MCVTTTIYANPSKDGLPWDSSLGSRDGDGVDNIDLYFRRARRGLGQVTRRLGGLVHQGQRFQKTPRPKNCIGLLQRGLKATLVEENKRSSTLLECGPTGLPVDKLCSLALDRILAGLAQMPRTPPSHGKESRDLGSRMRALVGKPG